MIEPSILTLAETFCISPAVVSRLAGTITDMIFLEEILRAINKPADNYYLRINLPKISADEIIKQMRSAFPDFEISKGQLPNIFKIGVVGRERPDLLEKWVYCDKFAAESVMVGADLFIPGVKGMKGRFPADEQVSILLTPPEVPQGQMVESFHVANGRAMMRSNDFPKYRKGIFIKNNDRRFSLPPYRHSSFFTNGYISDQNFPANVAVSIFMDHILTNMERHPDNPNAVDPVIFDTCSAPGHKSSGMAEIGRHQTALRGTPKWFNIFSIDRSKRRLLHLESDIVRLGLENITVVPIRLEKLLKQRPEYSEHADYLMFDPPCSALGTRPKLFIERSQKDLEDYASNQRRLFKIVHNLLKPGGMLMYNTCTIPKEENEALVAYAIRKYGYEVLPIPQNFAKLGNDGVSMDGLSEEERKRLLRFYPRLNDGMGYFIALLQKPFTPPILENEEGQNLPPSPTL